VKACGHLDSIREDVVPSSTEGCTDCLAIGERNWVHLRECLSCGHVACCDSSPHKHAAAHHRGSDHPVMRSIQPGEDWRWCYVDQVLV
jgi:Zn ribbon nucleic-acid-binding protein